MTFKQKLTAAGFKSKRAFAEYNGLHRNTVHGWGEDIPTWANNLLDLRIKVMELGRIE